DLEEVLARREIVEHLRQVLRGHRHALEQLDRGGAVVDADDDQRHEFRSSFASATRPARTRSTMPESKARCQSALSLERPEARQASRASESSSSRTSYSGPSSSFKSRRRWAARAGLRPPVPTATTRSARRITDIIVKEQFAGPSALLTQTRTASPAVKTAALTAGSSVAVSASQAPSRSPATNSRSASEQRPACTHSR